MASIRPGNKTALLVIDAQVGVLRDTWKTSTVLENICLVVEKAHQHSLPVVWVQHEDTDLAYQSPAWQLMPPLCPAAADLRLRKRFNSCFEQTSLEESLAAWQISHLILTGAATNWCVRATAHAALERGYDVTLVQDAHTTTQQEAENGLLLPAEVLVEELNLAFSWLSYPGRSNRAICAKDLAF